MAISKSLQDAKTSAEHAVYIDTKTTAPEDRPDYVCDEYTQAQEKRDVVRDVSKGTRHMRERGQPYLPIWEAEETEDYEKRLERAVLFNATKRTSEGLTGMVFRKAPILQADVPGRIVEEAENIDLAGRNLATFAKDVFNDGVLDGISFIHVDFPKVEPDPDSPKIKGKPTKKVEADAGVRPYWTEVLAGDFINWQWETVDGYPVLTLVVYQESTREPAGEYGTANVVRYRELRPGWFKVWEKRDIDGKEKFVLVDQGPIALPYIPFFPYYGKRVEYLEGEPPLEDLAHLNIEHWQVGSEHQHARTTASVPIMFLKGVDTDDGIKYGPAYALTAPAGEADVKWVETEGRSLNETREDKKGIEAQMASLGLSMLVRQQPGAKPTTATGDILEKSESDSTLSTMAFNLQGTLKACLQAHADYEHLDTGGSVEVNQDFHKQLLDPAMVTILSSMVAAGQLSLETMWDTLKTGEVLGEAHDAELELERIGTEGARMMGSQEAA